MNNQKGFVVVSTFFIALLVFIGAYTLLNNKSDWKQYDIKNIFNTGKENIVNPTSNPTPGSLNNSVIDLSNQGLKDIPSYVFSKTNTTELDISYNKIGGSIQAEIGQLSKLRVLNASNNNMTGVPAEIGHLQKLEVLNLSNNKITGLPNELGNLNNLRVLDISSNQYSEQDLEGIRNGLSSSVVIITK